MRLTDKNYCKVGMYEMCICICCHELKQELEIGSTELVDHIF